MKWRTWNVALLGYWIVFITGLVLGVFEFKWEVTLGDIALTVIGSLFTIGMLIFKIWLPRYPFTLRFFDKPWDTEDYESPSRKCKLILCQPGQETSFFIGVQLRTKRIIKTIDVRLLERDLVLFYSQPSKCPAKILAISDQEKRPYEGVGMAQVNGCDNKRGGIEATYPKAIDYLSKGAFLWYEVKIVATGNWDGWLSFQLRRGDTHKGHARARISIRIS